jgi:hypothetical protein
MLKLVGTDPEFFAFKDGRFLTSIEAMVDGSKDSPFQLATLGSGYAVQRDNVSVELNVPPAASEDDFVDYLRKCVGDVQQRYGIELKAIPSFEFSDEQLDNEEARTFGCSLDYCAYSKVPNKNGEAENKNLRAAGGHIHMAYSDPHIEKNKAIIKSMDLHLAVPMLLIDKDVDRRKLYGKAGCYRDTPYGIEYRTLSNFWLSSEELIRWVYRQTHIAYELGVNCIDDFTNGGIPSKLIEKVINTNDEKTALDLCYEFGIELPPKP